MVGPDKRGSDNQCKAQGCFAYKVSWLNCRDQASLENLSVACPPKIVISVDAVGESINLVKILTEPGLADYM